MSGQVPAIRKDRGGSAPRLFCDDRVLLGALSPMIGRDAELKAVCSRALAAEERLTTLVGPVGVGKSRLAVAAAEELAGVYPRGAYVVDLAADDCDTDPARAAAAALGLPAPPCGPTAASLADQLRDWEMLLVLDNCERVRADVAELVAALLPAARGLRVLATSREPLGLYGEHLFPVRPLPLPDPQPPTSLECLSRVPSVELFLQRVAAVRPGFRLTCANADIVAKLCHRLDGLPLAIEYAAMRLKVLQPQTLLVRLRQTLDVLAAGPSPTPPRRPGLRAVLTEYFQTLPAEAQTLLARLGTFVSGFSADAVESIADQPAGTVQRLLEVLCDKNFVQVGEQSERQLRFSLLQTTRLFALEVLTATGERDAVRQRHAEHFLSLVLPAAQPSPGADAERWLSALAVEHDNLEAAFRCLLEVGRRDDALRLAAALVRHWVARARPAEGLAWLEEALAADAPGVPAATVAALHAAGELAALRRDYARAAERQRQALLLSRRCGDRAAAAAALQQLGVTACLAGDLREARSLLEQSAKAWGAAGAPVGHASALVDLGALQLAGGDAPAARAAVLPALRVLEQHGERYGAARAHAVLADIASAERDPAVHEHCRQALAATQEFDPFGIVAPCLEALAGAAAAEGPSQYRRAVWLLAAAHARREEFGLPLPASRAPALRRVRDRLRAELGCETYAEEWAAGSALSPAAAVDGAADLARADPTGVALTPRQREVAELVARGLTNREIARELGVAEWTAVNHVRQVLRKLRYSSRVQVARWVAQQERPGPGGAD